MKYKIMFGLICSFAVAGCEEIEDLLTFNVNDRTSIRIESTMPVDLPLSIPMPDVSSNSEEQYENNNTHADLVKDVKLQELKLTITQPSGKSFSFLKSIRIFISTSQENEIELASLESVTATTGTITLNPTQEKLDVYAKAPTYNLRTELVTDEVLTQSVDVQVDLKFRVTADTF